MKRKGIFERLADGPVRTECLRIARSQVKAELKRQGIIVSEVEASDITKAAIEVINGDRKIFRQAMDNLNIGPRRKS